MNKLAFKFLRWGFWGWIFALVVGCSGSGSSGGSTGGNSLTCVQANSKTTAGATMTITNLSGQTISFDWIRSVNASGDCRYGQGAAYNFTSGQWDATFTNASGQVYQLSNNSCVAVPVDTSCLEGGANIYVVANTAANSFNSQMTSIPGQPNEATYPDIYGFAETGWTVGSTAIWDLSYVNSFGMPMQMSDGTDTIGIASGISRSTIINNLVSSFSNDTYSNLYESSIFPVGSTGSNVVRVFSPQHSYTSLPDSWASSINSGLIALSSTTGQYESFVYGGFLYNNYTSSGNQQISSTCTNLSTGYSTTCTLSNITTGNAIAGAITYSPNVAPGESGTVMAAKFAGMISAGINRGVLGTPQYWGTSGNPNTASAYYQYWYQTVPYNVYAKVLTGYGINHMLYADSYDDFWSMSSSLTIGSTNNKVSLTILPF